MNSPTAGNSISSHASYRNPPPKYHAALRKKLAAGGLHRLKSAGRNRLVQAEFLSGKRSGRDLLQLPIEEPPLKLPASMLGFVREQFFCSLQKFRSLSL